MNTWCFVHAHPDDETLWTGGLIATAAAKGDRVVVVTCTRGERGEVITAPGTATEGKGWLFGNHEALAEHRTGELRAALGALGNGRTIEHYFLDELDLPRFCDGGGHGLLAQNDEGMDEAAYRHPAQGTDVTPSQDLENPNMRYVDSGMVWLVEPSVDGDDPRTSTGGVAGPDPNAEGGFATAPLFDEAERLAGLLQSFRDSATTPKGSAQHDVEGNGPALRVVTYEADGGYGHPDHVRAHDVAVRAIEMLNQPGTELWEVTTPGEPYDIQIELRPVLPQLLAAMQAYASQVQNVREDDNPAEGRVGWFGLSNGVPLAIYDTEKYRVTTI